MKKALCLVVMAMAVFPSSALTQQPADPGETVAAFHRALASGDRDQVLGLLSPDLILFEDTSKEASRREYASHHLGADMKFSAQASRKILDQKIRIEENISWVMTRYSVKGKAGGKQIKLESAETAVLEKVPEGWRIAHIHWSNRVL